MSAKSLFRLLYSSTSTVQHLEISRVQSLETNYCLNSVEVLNIFQLKSLCSKSKTCFPQLLLQIENHGHLKLTLGASWSFLTPKYYRVKCHYSNPNKVRQNLLGLQGHLSILQMHYHYLCIALFTVTTDIILKNAFFTIIDFYTQIVLHLTILRLLFKGFIMICIRHLLFFGIFDRFLEYLKENH